MYARLELEAWARGRPDQRPWGSDHPRRGHLRRSAVDRDGTCPRPSLADVIGCPDEQGVTGAVRNIIEGSMDQTAARTPAQAATASGGAVPVRVGVGGPRQSSGACGRFAAALPPACLPAGPARRRGLWVSWPARVCRQHPHTRRAEPPSENRRGLMNDRATGSGTDLARTARSLATAGQALESEPTSSVKGSS